MILVIAGTNRPKSNTELVAKHVLEILAHHTKEKLEYLSLRDMQQELLHEHMYESSGMGKKIKEIQDTKFIPAEKWILISPEYNGSFPGIVKLMLDALSVRKADDTFQEKKVALIGVSSGRAGNWLGMNQLTSILHYLKIHVYHNKLAIRNVSKVIDPETQKMDIQTQNFLENQIIGFLKF